MKRVVLDNLWSGFIAGALAILFFHQSMLFFWVYTGWIKATPWSLAAVPPLGVPLIINNMFWGGVWGVIFTFIGNRFPLHWDYVLKGVIFGLLGPMLFDWLIMPFFHDGTFMAGGFFKHLATDSTINAFYGLGLALLLPLCSLRHRSDKLS